jgi:hypothetical protein
MRPTRAPRSRSPGSAPSQRSTFDGPQRRADHHSKSCVVRPNRPPVPVPIQRGQPSTTGHRQTVRPWSAWMSRGCKRLRPRCGISSGRGMAAATRGTHGGQRRSRHAPITTGEPSSLCTSSRRARPLSPNCALPGGRLDAHTCYSGSCGRMAAGCAGSPRRRVVHRGRVTAGGATTGTLTGASTKAPSTTARRRAFGVRHRPPCSRRMVRRSSSRRTSGA